LEYCKYINQKIDKAEWGDSVVMELAKYIQLNEPEIKGFSDKNIWRMKQFYETYKDFPKLSTLLREISWSHNLAIFSRCKTIEEREFYSENYANCLKMNLIKNKPLLLTTSANNDGAYGCSSSTSRSVGL